MTTKKLDISKESAGSGKTFHLSNRYIEYLLDDKADSLAYKRILAVTFTNAATAEMKERILKYLNTDKGDGKYAQKKAFLSRIVHDYSMFKVSTIDSFFQSVVRSFAFELGKKNSYELSLDGDDAVNESLNSLYKTVKDNPSLVKTLEKIALEGAEDEKAWDFRKRIAEFCSNILKDEFLKVKREEPELFSKASKGAMEGSIKMMEEFCNSFAQRWFALYHRIGALFNESGLESSDFFNGTRSSIFSFLTAAFDSYTKSLKNPHLKVKTLPVSLDHKVFDLYNSFETEWLPRKPKNEEALRSLYDEVSPLIEELKGLLESRECKYYRSYIAVLDKIKETSLLGDVYSQLKDYCDREGVALIAETPDLVNTLIGDGKDAPFIYEKIGGRINHFLLDEFQDTSSVQWSNFSPLIHESLAQNFENLIVGDVKQSIYRWRGGDWRILNSGLEEEFKDAVVPDSDKPEAGQTTNYRSLENIVEFNNYIFERLPALIDSQYDGISPKPFTETDSLSHIYAGCSQKICEDNLERAGKGHCGFVKVVSFNKKYGKVTSILKNDAFILKKTLQIIQSLTDKQKPESKRYKGGQIAVLVDSKEHGRDVVDYLMHNGVKVVSGEAALIDSSDAVFTMLVLLKYLSTRQIEWIAILESLYNVKIRNKEMLSEIPLSDSVYNICRVLMENCLPEDMLKDVVFLTAFIDKLQYYSLKEGADISGFLKWWNQGREGFTIPTPETKDAVSVMTMHKAKGLEKEVIIIPHIRDYTDAHAKMKKEESHWVKCTDPDFLYKNKVLVRFNDSLSNSVFEKEYEKEKYNSVVDCTNLLYVSLTRAKEKLYVFDSRQNENSLTYNFLKLCQDNPFFIKKDFSISFEEAQKDGFTDQEIYNPDGRPFEYSEFTYGEENEEVVDWSDKKENDAAESLDINEITPRNMFTSVRKGLRISDFSDEDDVRRQGILLHMLYSYLNECSPEEAAAKLFANSPSASSLGCSEEELVCSVKDNLAKVAQYEWFNTVKYRTYAESDILFKGAFYRPDRVLVSADGSMAEAVVVDYKFGKIKKKEYVGQVQRYCKLLREMGFANVKGYLWYVTLEEVEEV